MSNGKILYLVQPEAKRPRTENNFIHLQNPLPSEDDDAVARQHFYDLLKGVWPNTPRRPS